MGPPEASCFRSPRLSLALPKSQGRAWELEPGEARVMMGSVGRGSPLACS